jgi:hypothetical protein
LQHQMMRGALRRTALSTDLWTLPITREGLCSPPLRQTLTSFTTSALLLLRHSAFRFQLPESYLINNVGWCIYVAIRVFTQCGNNASEMEQSCIDYWQVIFN